MKLKLVVDNNIFISSIRFDCDNNSSTYKTYLAVVKDVSRFELITSDVQISELRDVTHRDEHKGKINPILAGFIINILRRKATKVIIKPLVSKESNDPKDDFLIAMCESSAADILVTGDKKAGLLQRGKIGQTIVLTAAQFVENYILKDGVQNTFDSLESLMQINSEHYTVQVAEAASEKVLSFAAHGIPGRYWIVPVKEDDKLRYVLLSGNFVRRESASIVAEEMEKRYSLKGEKAFVRQFGEVQSIVRSYRRFKRHANKIKY